MTNGHGLKLDAAAAHALATAADDAYVVIDDSGGIEFGYYAPVGQDPQQPHDRDELYIIAAGHGRFVCGDSRVAFGPGDRLFVAAGETHRFVDFDEGFGTWVLFFGPIKAMPD
jgi:mannose-6-phosphate isomerase-like protein (cupin superfamily)